MNTLFEDDEFRPLMRIGDFGLVKYQPKKKEAYQMMDEKIAGWIKEGNPHFGSFNVEMTNKGIKVKRGINNERQYVLEEILAIINQERKASNQKKKYPPLTGRALAIKLAHVPTEDLYFMLSSGKDYKARGKGEFGKYVFGSIKVKDEKNAN